MDDLIKAIGVPAQRLAALLSLYHTGPISWRTSERGPRRFYLSTDGADDDALMVLLNSWADMQGRKLAISQWTDLLSSDDEGTARPDCLYSLWCSHLQTLLDTSPDLLMLRDLPYLVRCVSNAVLVERTLSYIAKKHPHLMIVGIGDDLRHYALRSLWDDTFFSSAAFSTIEAQKHLILHNLRGISPNPHEISATLLCPSRLTAQSYTSIRKIAIECALSKPKNQHSMSTRSATADAMALGLKSPTLSPPADLQQHGTMTETIAFRTVENALMTWLDSPTQSKRRGQGRYTALMSYCRPPNGLLLHGPPGSGKTAMVRSLMEKSKTYVSRGLRSPTFMTLRLTDILRAHTGEGEKAIDEMFRRAVESAPAILFLDEMEALFGRQDDDSVSDPMLRKLATNLLAHMDRIMASDTSFPIFFIGATNYLQKLDKHVRRVGRFETTILVDTITTQESVTELLSTSEKGTVTYARSSRVTLDEGAHRKVVALGHHQTIAHVDGILHHAGRAAFYRSSLADSRETSAALCITTADVSGATAMFSHV